MEPTFSISQISTLARSLDDDLRAYRAAGADGIGLWELKLPPPGEDGRTLAAVRASGLTVTNCVPLVPSILPFVHLPGPADPDERVEAFCASVERLARFGPASIVLLTGSARGLEPRAARERVVAGLREIADCADRCGATVALEPHQRVGGEDWSIVYTLGEAAALLDEARTPQIRLLFDVWHLWNTPDLLEEIDRHAGRIGGVHVGDYRDPPRAWADRVLPGDGVADLPAILGALERAGWDGPYDLEIFSDDGTFGTALPDSLWTLEGEELARRGREAFLEAWRRRR